MSFRTILISNRCKLDLRMNYMEVRSDKVTKVLLDDLEVLMIENPAVSLTGCLLEALIDKKVKVIFCDHQHNPYAELLPCHGSHDSSRKIKVQAGWKEEVKGVVWTQIVSDKIRKQSEHLRELECFSEADMLLTYVDEIEYRDTSNREGHAAKVYFNKLFGMKFSRNKDCATNAALDYGYSLLLSSFNKEIVANGYLTQCGLFHDNIYNPYNLSCDLMEPFRVIVDRKVKKESFQKFETEEKHKMLHILQEEVMIAGTKQYVSNAIKIYAKSVLDALCKDDIERLIFYEL